MNDIAQIFTKLTGEYAKHRTRKTQMVDGLIAYSLTTAFIQFAYVVLVGNFPFNSFLSGLICHLALFAFAVSLRLQLTSPSEFQNVTPERALGDFILCGLVLFFVVFSFMG